MIYYLYISKRTKTATLHSGWCEDCNLGQGKTGTRAAPNWLGPFESIAKARGNTGGLRLMFCRKCRLSDEAATASLTDHILRQINQCGYLCVELDEGEKLALVAEPTIGVDDVVDPTKPRAPRPLRQLVRIDGTDEESRYRAACQLASQCGLDLE